MALFEAVELVKLKAVLVWLTLSGTTIIGTIMIISEHALVPAVQAQGAAPSVNQIDQHIADSLKEINKKYNSDATTHDSDVLEANWKLLAYIKNACKRMDFLKAPLKAAKDAGLNRITSSDGKLCLNGWDTLTGGTMHIYWAVAQYQDGDAVNCQLLNPVSMNDRSGGSGY